MNTDPSSFLDQSLAIRSECDETMIIIQRTSTKTTTRKRKMESNAAGGLKKRRSSNETKSPCPTTTTKNIKHSIQMPATKFKTFPERMMDLLDLEKQTAFYWRPDGVSFGLLPSAFTVHILNVYFQGTKFESFTRKLNRWGFQRIFVTDDDSNAFTYQHPQFQKGRYDLLRELTSRSNNNKRKTKEQQPQKSPLPCHSRATVTPVSVPAQQQPPAQLQNTAISTGYHPLTLQMLTPPRLSIMMPGSNYQPTAVELQYLLFQQQQQRFQQERALLARLQAELLIMNTGNTHLQQQQQQAHHRLLQQQKNNSPSSSSVTSSRL